MTKTLNELATEIYEISKSKGFYDEPVPFPQICALIHSDISELWGAEDKDAFIPDIVMELSDPDFKKFYVENIKGSQQEEFADIVIRILDHFGSKNKFIEGRLKKYGFAIDSESDWFSKSLLNMHAYVSKALECDRNGVNYFEHLEAVLYYCNSLCVESGIDLEQHILLKMRYNSLRPPKHGKNY